MPTMTKAKVHVNRISRRHACLLRQWLNAACLKRKTLQGNIWGLPGCAAPVWFLRLQMFRNKRIILRPFPSGHGLRGLRRYYAALASEVISGLPLSRSSSFYQAALRLTDPYKAVCRRHLESLVSRATGNEQSPLGRFTEGAGRSSGFQFILVLRFPARSHTPHRGRPE